MQIWLAAFRDNTAPVLFGIAPSLRADIVSGRTPLVARSAPVRKQKWLEIEKNLGVPEKQYIVGDCDYLLVTLAASKAAEVVGGFDHVDSGTR